MPQVGDHLIFGNPGLDGRRLVRKIEGNGTLGRPFLIGLAEDEARGHGQVFLVAHCHGTMHHVIADRPLRVNPHRCPCDEFRVYYDRIFGAP
ncbi:MAG: hypothetical protein UV82_C0010G0043 [Candidatus Magasanikbacteria bacterium GW2011_GWD2_43_18]|uniref:Uncharacterized protein n=1 Tax=Candidatus Magasanikbacteria bacterium GW2011_GWE2_42_7 TaxID=1619052 RepID=A0A0G1BF53_9BACT|nr:MAG: hypothetical protein UV18_C0005G0140 [Candidatus Magasanikbacteria bacterium GW2011_GWC2_42_27]KKS71809.1 MAG: hypothetical protein UV42_C0019G0033 [Candidatus Magasanikbacteria bacterium GW2011_GWE2_42_7]KKT04227.1 MAG: hypothetical protein UV82_C0010G0043 [Candidatus Magasanikbacteria bacterium GW2011_GWD2_43_18]KKT25921.1 MAG: hypothetical protein UW10_C0003G0082 [Candidatus Magasanikbacteria bacterium GW2011_GWA2_43_9]HBB37898.1 hypothetical protein [Candidatus Magasanikbacteria bac